ncbi:metallophosphoesterase family protein [Streptacidiphilus jiangxiensis]|uniref:Calcineurin-like phosphoesterase n=1 Tax=Streptacidiphilus jiangxiensis TaxID=235985 RepID=A0A1H7ZBF1_STRJI|nr:metallophosphoesterase [Streptacidiphilus jiangxiensis]SEM55882.1 Calcineurin-like phosphoesterase [Streptacidiphilus jiangxiensis]
MRRVTKISAATVGLAVLAVTGTAVAAAGHGSNDNDWPYAHHSEATYTLAAVGDIACEPDDPENAGTPTSLKCGSPTLGGMSAEFATAGQATAMHPDAVALLGDEQYQVGKLTDFQQSFDQAWGGLKMLERPAPGNHEYYPYAKKGDNEAGQNGNGYFSYFNGHDQSGAPTNQGQAGDDTADNQGWYSYNLGNWHIISLNAECNSDAFNHDCSTTDNGLLAQETQWLSQDLAANSRPCTIAYWHQPTFSATTASTATVPAAAPGAGGVEGAAADAWWQLLYQNHATLVLNGHEHAYARLRAMDPAGDYDPKHGIPEFVVGSGGEALDTLAGTAGNYDNPNVVTGQAGAFGVLKLTLKSHGYSWDYQPVLPGPGFDSSALQYRDTGTGSCR